MSWMRWIASLMVCGVTVACAAAPDSGAEPGVESREEALTTDLTGDPPGTPPASADDITITPPTADLHVGCNRNTNCRFNCMWCGIHSCRCTAKGIP